MNDALLILWIALMGIIPNLIIDAALGALLFWWGKKQGERSYLMAKEEIKKYVQEELVVDVTKGIEKSLRDGINGIFGPVAKAGTAEARAIAAQYAQENPSIFQLLTGVATRSGLSWGLKQLGAPKEVRDAFKITGPINLGAPAPRGSPELAPVRPPGP